MSPLFAYLAYSAVQKFSVGRALIEQLFHLGAAWVSLGGALGSALRFIVSELVTMEKVKVIRYGAGGGE